MMLFMIMLSLNLLLFIRFLTHFRSTPASSGSSPSHDPSNHQEMILGSSSFNPPQPAIPTHYHHHFNGPPNPPMTSSLCHPFSSANTFGLGHHQPVASSDPHHDFLLRTAVTHW